MTAYKQTELGLIPSDWEVVALGDIGETIIGLTYSPSNVKSFGTLVLRSSNIQNNKLEFQDNVFVDMDLPERVITKENDILICVRNGSRQLIGKCALINKKASGSAFGAFMSIFRTPNANFVFYAFQSSVIQNQIKEVMGATINQITNKNLSEFKISIPTSTTEQTAIATALSDTDALLAELEKLLAKKQAIKTATMQQLLTGKTRLPEFAHRADGTPKGSLKTEWGDIPEDWEVVSIGDIANLYQPETISSSQLQSCGYPVYGANGIIGFYKHYNHVEPQVMVTCRGSTCGTVNMSVPYSWITGNAMVVDVHSKINKKFVYYLLDYQDLTICITGSGQPQIVRTPLSNFKVIIPKSTTEQTAIAQILGDMDSEITALQARIEKLREIKQGMMQNLLTGKIRLPF